MNVIEISSDDDDEVETFNSRDNRKSSSDNAESHVIDWEKKYHVLREKVNSHNQRLDDTQPYDGISSIKSSKILLSPFSPEKKKVKSEFNKEILRKSLFQTDAQIVKNKIYEGSLTLNPLENSKISNKWMHPIASPLATSPLATSSPSTTTGTSPIMERPIATSSPSTTTGTSPIMERPICYHLDDPDLPIFSKLKSIKDYSKSEKENMLQETAVLLKERNINPSLVCYKPPRFVKQNLSFVVDTRELENVGDLLADDCGAWHNNGQHKFFYCDGDENGLLRLFDDSESQFVLHKHYYKNKSAPDFKKFISFMTDENGRYPLTRIDYQFEYCERPFKILPHGNNKHQRTPYARTQSSTKSNLQIKLKRGMNPNKAVDIASEESGGLMNYKSSGALPRNKTQAYNLNRAPKQAKGSNPLDPFQCLIIEAKSQSKDPKSCFISCTISAPQPIAYLVNKRQLDELKKYCTNESKFGILQADATFDLGDFSVTVTTYEHLLLLSRSSNKHPVMIGPMMVHQKKDKQTYKGFMEFLVQKEMMLKNVRAFGTDGEKPLYESMEEVFDNATHLLCSIHFKRNIKDKLTQIGIGESGKRSILADIFGHQVELRFEEGIVDSRDEDEFFSRLNSLKEVWERREGKKGSVFFNWFQKNKSNLMARKMISPIRAKAGLGFPPQQFSTNRVECINSLLKKECGVNSTISKFVKDAQNVVERQQRDVDWALIGKGPYKLLPCLERYQSSEEEWCAAVPEKRETLRKQFLEIDPVTTIFDDIDFDECSLEEVVDTPSPDVVESGLSILAKVALSDGNSKNKTDSLSIGREKFRNYFRNQPDDLSDGIYDKAIKLVTNPGNLSHVPGCEKRARMVASTRFKSKPHHVTAGKKVGDFRCDKACPHFNAIRCCSHVIAAAESNNELQDFLSIYRSGTSNVNLTSLVKTDMPQYPGKKGGLSSTQKRSTPKPPPKERVPRIYNMSQQKPVNIQPFRLKEVNLRMKVCQSCRGDLKVDEGIPPAPHDFCIARKEKRPFFNRNLSKYQVPDKASDGHYHFRLECVRAEERNFSHKSLVIPDEIRNKLLEVHRGHLFNEFNIILE